MQQLTHENEIELSPCNVCGNDDICCGDDQDSLCHEHCHHEQSYGRIGINGLERGE